MKTVLGFLIPLFLAIAVFLSLVFFFNQNEGKGVLQVTSVPKSTVYLDGKLMGDSPLEAKTMLKVGEYTLKIVPKEGDFQPFEDKITIYKSTITVVDRTFSNLGQSEGSIITLSQISDKDAQILVLSFPDKATVSLDNDPKGSSPILLKNITESDHDLLLEKEGYKDKLLKIRAKIGYKLTALVFLGISSLSSSGSAGLVDQSGFVPVVQKVKILNTPTGFLRVRADAGLGGSEIGKVNPGDIFDLLDEKNGWFKIKFGPSTGGEKSGWISSDYGEKQ